ERWQRRLLLRHPDQANTWRQLAGLQQMAGSEDKALATLRAAHAKGLRFSEAELDNLVLLASAAGQPWQGAKLLEGMLESRLVASTRASGGFADLPRAGRAVWQCQALAQCRAAGARTGQLAGGSRGAEASRACRRRASPGTRLA